MAWGQCGHSYHFHCITRWLRTRSTCPLGNRLLVPASHRRHCSFGCTLLTCRGCFSHTDDDEWDFVQCTPAAIRRRLGFRSPILPLPRRLNVAGRAGCSSVAGLGNVGLRNVFNCDLADFFLFLDTNAFSSFSPPPRQVRSP